MIKQPHTELTLIQQQRKLLYISQLLMQDPKFDEEVRAALHRSLKRNVGSLPKLISLSEMTPEEILDINNPIE